MTTAADVNELSGLADEVPGEDQIQDMNEAPGQIGNFYPAPRPGTYLFRMPPTSALGAEVFEQYYDKNTKPRLRVKFQDSAKLSIVSLGEQPFTQNISGTPVPRGKQKILVSDLNYLLAALGHSEIPPAPKKQAELIQKSGGSQFKGDISWKAFCNPKKDIYVYNEQLGQNEKQENVKGCGQEFAQDEFSRQDGTKVLGIPREADGSLSESFQCSCSASLRVFPQLRNFQPVK